PRIYEENRRGHPNLRLSQWGCYEGFAKFDQPKDLRFTFAGQVYGERIPACRYLRREAGLQVFGHMSGMVSTPSFLYWPLVRPAPVRFPSVSGPPLPFQGVNAIWNRTRVSYTPMEASVGAHVLQIKSRTFEMGLSGTLMLCKQAPDMERYYEPDKEF